jgi:hypothetical protein
VGFQDVLRVGASGIVYDFFIYTGSTTFDHMNFSQKESKLGSGGKVVAQLAKPYPIPRIV